MFSLDWLFKKKQPVKELSKKELLIETLKTVDTSVFRRVHSDDFSHFYLTPYFQDILTYGQKIESYCSFFETKRVIPPMQIQNEVFEQKISISRFFINKDKIFEENDKILETFIALVIRLFEFIIAVENDETMQLPTEYRRNYDRLTVVVNNIIGISERIIDVERNRRL